MLLNNSPFLKELDKCPVCNIPLKWGVTTRYDEDLKSEICAICKAVLGDRPD